MFPRKAYSKLLDWKSRSQGQTAILVEGARRTGKSTLVKSFGQKEYTSHILIDFSEAPDEVLDLFRQYRGDVDTFLRYLQLFYDTRLVERNSLVIFDEVQRFPTAREFIKQLVADGRFDYIETGSLVSIKSTAEDILIPSEERSMWLAPFDFEEFLWAVSSRALADEIRNSFEGMDPLPAAIHRKCERLFREYMAIGGMPQAIQKYIDTGDFAEVDEVKRAILELYRNDIAKFGGSDSPRIRGVFSEIPGQLSKHEKRFTLTDVNGNARMREYAGAFLWLEDAGMVNICRNSSDPNVGLRLSEDGTTYKCYLGDTGLLSALAFADNETTPSSVYRDIIFDRLGVNEGMIVENAVAQQLKASGHSLHFYSARDDASRENTMEVDFLVTREYDDAAGKMRVSPIEVKSTKRYGTKSLDKFKAKFGKRVGTQYVLHPKPMSANGERIHLPLYMAHLL